jgi:hypothetical protein
MMFKIFLFHTLLFFDIDYILFEKSIWVCLLYHENMIQVSNHFNIIRKNYENTYFKKFNVKIRWHVFVRLRLQPWSCFFGFFYHLEPFRMGFLYMKIHDLQNYL